MIELHYFSRFISNFFAVTYWLFKLQTQSSEKASQVLQQLKIYFALNVDLKPHQYMCISFLALIQNIINEKLDSIS